MQSAAPEAVDLNQESAATRTLYGLEEKRTEVFGRQCLLARRLVERGVRFVQLYSGGNHGDSNWDAHGDLVKNHELHAGATDRPIAGLIQDLKQRGLLDDTLIVWGGEFGRTVYSQGAVSKDNYGRDHHPRCYSLWVSGAGIRRGHVIGETDDFCYNIVRDPVHVRDFHATILALLGLDHERLSFRFQGLDQRLTGVDVEADHRRTAARERNGHRQADIAKPNDADASVIVVGRAERKLAARCASRHRPLIFATLSAVWP